MERSSKIALLSATTLLFWMWQLSMPIFDKRLPFLSIHDGGFRLSSIEESENGGIVISISEVIALYVGVATIVSVYGLFWTSSDGKASFWQSASFVALATVTSLGNGMHAVCVIAQLQINRDNPLYELLDFVHERWSHYMFQTGMFGLLLVIMWVEKPNLPPSPSSTNQIKGLSKLWLLYLGPLLTALFTAIFSNLTETSGIAMAFYVTSLASSVVLLMRSDGMNIWEMFSGEKFLTLRYFVTVAVLGIPSLLVHLYWLI